MKEFIYNPIIKGFNPDPSIVRVKEDYYIATSTFEWFPGVQIFHSKDLLNWELVSRPLNRRKQIDLKGVPDSGGIWAPDISYKDGKFYLAYTIVRTHKSIWRDMHNFLTTSDSISQGWSDAVFLNSSGHDPAFFHDTDGKSWLLNVEWKYANGKNYFNGIIIQEYSLEKKILIGQKYNIFKGTEAGFTEGPHLYRRNGYYYLITAEGGTWYDHCVTIARSNNLFGPYEIYSDNPILTSKNNKALKLQKTGHADLVESHHGKWYLVHLCGRPITKSRCCVMGRESAIQEIKWSSDGWPISVNSKKEPSVKVELPTHVRKIQLNNSFIDEFNEDKLNINFQTLRVPLGKNKFSLKSRKGHLRLIGQESLSSLHYQSLVAVRQQSFCYISETMVEFEPSSTGHMAGLVVYYNTENYYYLCMSYNSQIGKILRLITCNKNILLEPTRDGLLIENNSKIGLRITVNNEKGQFYYSTDEKNWLKIGELLDMSKLSDDYIGGKAFTGTFIGICCQDLTGENKYADFDYFKYEEFDLNPISYTHFNQANCQTK